MTGFVRLIRFNAVGGMGMALQLTVLAALSRLTSHYLVATAVAIEAALLHNFTWHLHYTWQDRTGADRSWQRWARFHLSNGSVSMLGSMAIMPLLIEGVKMPVLAANASAVLACSLVNFLLGDRWVFARSSSGLSGGQATSGEAGET